MHEIHMVALIQIFEDGAFLLVFREDEGIPADVRDFKRIGNTVAYRADVAGDEAEAIIFAIFETLVEEHLHTEANAQQRFAAFSFGYNEFVEAVFGKFCPGITKGANAGKNEFIGLLYHFGVACDDDVCADTFKGGGKAEKISYPIVYYCNHYRTPFVEGISFWYSGLIFTAAQSVLPRALKVPSMMW